MPQASRTTRLNVAAVAAALAVAALVTFIPVYSVDSSATGSSSETLVEHEGLWVLAVVLAPALLAAIPLLLPAAWRHTSLVTVATVAVLFVLVTGFTIGLFFAPTAILLVWAASLSDRPA
jgi:hypothetical protein